MKAQHGKDMIIAASCNLRKADVVVFWNVMPVSGVYTRSCHDWQLCGKSCVTTNSYWEALRHL